MNKVNPILTGTSSVIINGFSAQFAVDRESEGVFTFRLRLGSACMFVMI